jgi:hypothetical protein
MARHIGGTLTLALLMVAGGGGFSISQKKRPLSGHSATLEHIGVDILWANAALAAHCQQYGQPVVTYENLAEDLHDCLAFEPVFNQPAEKPQKTPGEVGESKFVKPVAQRLVKVVDDRYQHFLEALNADPPGLDTCSKYSLPAACKQALAFMLHKGTALPKWRRYQVEKLRRIAHRLRPLDAALKKLPAAQRSESVNNLESKVRQVDVGMLCLLGDVLRHPDTTLPRGYLYGFNVTGIIKPSGVLRPKPPSGTEQTFWLNHAATMRTNDSWADNLAHDVSCQAKAASGTHLKLLKQTWQLTEAEVQAGYSGAGMSLTQLRTKYGRGVDMRCRVLRRHGVRQGQKQKKDASGNNITQSDGSPLMVDKIRMIDDSKRSLSNSMLQRCCETIAPCRFTYLAYVADELVTQCAAQHKAVPQLVFSLDDMK